MYLIVIAWLYVALMMAVAEASHPQGTILGAVFTFLLYGIAPVSLVVYLLSHPARRKLRAEREAREARAAAEAASAVPPDTGGEAPADPVPPVRKEP